MDDFYSHSLEMHNGKTMSMNHFRGTIVVFDSVCWCALSLYPWTDLLKQAFIDGRLAVVQADHHHHCRVRGFEETWVKEHRESTDRTVGVGEMIYRDNFPMYLTGPITPDSRIWTNPIWDFLKCPNKHRQNCKPSHTAIIDPTGKLSFLEFNLPLESSKHYDHVEELLLTKRTQQ